MNLSKSLSTAIAAALLFAVLSCSGTAQNVRNLDTQRDTQRDFDSLSVSLPHNTEQGGDNSDINLSQLRTPSLRIGGRESHDVYLQSLDIQVEVTGNIASTRYTMIFKNRTNRTLEGELTFPLPDGRSVTFYALDINGRMREAVPVEKARAAHVFEEIQRREVDPGILERVEGNNFRTRIYPFPPLGTRTISVGYEEELTLENELLYYRLPMAYPDPLKEFSVTATVWKSSLEPIVPQSEDEIRFDRAGENYVASFTREDYQPSRSLIFALPVPVGIPQIMMQPAQGSFYFLVSAAPNLEPRKKQWSDELAIIWDVSLSGSQRNLQREMEMLDIIFTEKRNAGVHLYFLNNELKKITGSNTGGGEYEVVDGNWGELRSTLERAVFDGGTNFSKIDLSYIAGDEILFFSDGISTLSEPDFLKNTSRDQPMRPVHCIVSSSKADYSVMRLIAGKTRGKFVNINALSPEKLREEALNETPLFLGAEHDGTLREVYPGITMPVHGDFSIAGISDADSAGVTLLFGFGGEVEKRINVELDTRNAGSLGNIYRIWAQKKIAELDLDYETNRAELTELGQQFGIVTRNTSLMVLELVEDYVRYGIEPPDTEPELLAEYQRRLKNRQLREMDGHGVNMLSNAVAAAVSLTNWWGTSSTSGQQKFPVPDTDRSTRGESGPAGTAPGFGSGFGGGTSSGISRATDGPERVGEGRESMVLSAPGSSPGRGESSAGRRSRGHGERAAEPSSSRRGSSRSAFAFEAAEVTGYLDNPVMSSVYITDMDDPNADFVTLMPPSIHEIRNMLIEPIRPGYHYRLTGDTAKDYQIYLELRNAYSSSITFYFDMADWFFKHNARETALRILTSIAELELENASLYRLLGYRFKEYGEYALAKFVTKKVVQWRPLEPQNYRDHALALADNGEAQAALDSLYSLLTRPFPANVIRRSRGLEEVVVTEINRLIAKDASLNTSQIDERLIINIPVDIRVVINWNMDNTDIDLHVRDPNGEECYYGNSRTMGGGRISADNTSGYGPEQFLLKRAVNGKYQVYVNYYSAREFTAAGPATVMAEIFTKYAGKNEQRRVVSLQLLNTRGRGGRKAMVAEFEF